MRSNRNPVAAAFLMGMFALTGCGVHLPQHAMSAQASRQAVQATGTYTLISQPDGSARTAILQAIDTATTSIDLTMYSLTDPGIVDHLVAAANRGAGVTVRVIFEPDPHYFTPAGHRPVPTVTPPAATAAKRADMLDLIAANEPVPTPTPPSQGYVSNQAAVNDLVTRTASARRPAVASAADDMHFALTHEKGMVVDHQVAFIMSNNFTHSGLGPNREYGVIDRNRAEVAEVEAIFQADFQHSNYLVSQPNLVVSPDDGTGQGNARAKIKALILSAKHSIRIEDEEFGDPEMAALLDAQVAAGKSVQMIVDPSDHTKAAAWFAPNGVNLLGWGPPDVSTPGKRGGMHAKLIIVDDATAYLGSINLSFQSMGYNREVGILLSDPSILPTLVQDFTADWTAASAVRKARQPKSPAPRPRKIPSR
jgi:phosphatidylserine/phosphatidylglycerophosphate/cardiolipin synthase-like enzyme